MDELIYKVQVLEDIVSILKGKVTLLESLFDNEIGDRLSKIEEHLGFDPEED